MASCGPMKLELLDEKSDAIFTTKMTGSLMAKFVGRPADVVIRVCYEKQRRILNCAFFQFTLTHANLLCLAWSRWTRP